MLSMHEGRVRGYAYNEIWYGDELGEHVEFGAFPDDGGDSV